MRIKHFAKFLFDPHCTPHFASRVWLTRWFNPRNIRIGQLNTLGITMSVLALTASYHALTTEWRTIKFITIFVVFAVSFTFRAKQLMSVNGQVETLLKKGGHTKAASHFSQVTTTLRTNPFGLRLIPFWTGFACTLMLLSIIVWKPFIKQ